MFACASSYHYQIQHIKFTIYRLNQRTQDTNLQWTCLLHFLRKETSDDNYCQWMRCVLPYVWLLVVTINIPTLSAQSLLAELSTKVLNILFLILCILIIISLFLIVLLKIMTVLSEKMTLHLQWQMFLCFVSWPWLQFAKTENYRCSAQWGNNPRGSIPIKE